MIISRLRPLGALALSLSVCGGLFSLSPAQAATKPKTTKPAKKPQNPLDKVLSTLGLTAQQKAAIKLIINDANAQIKALNADTTLTDAEKATAHKAICAEAFADIASVLTDEQKATFDAWVAAQPTAKPEKPKKDKPKGDKPPKKTSDDSTDTGVPTDDSGKDCPKGDKPKGGKPPKGEKPTTPTTPTTPDDGDSSNST